MCQVLLALLIIEGSFQSTSDMLNLVYTGLLCVPWFVYSGFDKIVPGWDYVPGFDNCQPYSSLCSLIRTIKYIISQCTLLNSVDNSLYIVVYGIWHCSWSILIILLPLWCFSIVLAFNIVSCMDMVWYITCSLWLWYMLVLSCLCLSICYTFVEMDGVSIRVSTTPFNSSKVLYVSIYQHCLLLTFPDLSRTVLNLVWYLLSLCLCLYPFSLVLLTINEYSWV